MSAPSPRGWGAVVADAVGITLVTLSGALAAVLTCTLVPLYAGSTVLPVAVLLALVSTVALPRLAFAIVARTVVAALPFAAWLLVAIGLSTARPEGDVILPGDGPGGVTYVTYGVLLVGALAGAVTLIASANPARPTSARPDPASPNSPRPKPAPQRPTRGR